MGVFGPSEEGILPGVGVGLHWSCLLVLCWPISMRFLSESGHHVGSVKALACTVNPSRQRALYCQSQPALGPVLSIPAYAGPCTVDHRAGSWSWWLCDGSGFIGYLSISFLHIVTGGSD
ncbi:unnamed protein product [Boreogadus saida]